MRHFFSLPIVDVNRFASQWSAFALVHGVTGAIVGTLTNAMVIWVELSLLGVLGGALLLLDPRITLFAVGYFGLIGILMNQTLKGWAYSTGKVMAETDWESNLNVQDGIATYREITVANRRQYYIDRFRSLRQAGSEAYADQQFIGSLPRYGMEVALVVGAVLLVAASAPARHRGIRPWLPRAVPHRRDPGHALHAAAERVPDHLAVPGAPRRLRLHDGGPHPGPHAIGHAAGHSPGGART